MRKTFELEKSAFANINKHYALVIHFYDFTCAFYLDNKEKRKKFSSHFASSSCVVLMEKNTFASAPTLDGCPKLKGVPTIERNLWDSSPSFRLTFNRRRIFFFIVVWEKSRKIFFSSIIKFVLSFLLPTEVWEKNTRQQKKIDKFLMISVRFPYTHKT